MKTRQSADNTSGVTPYLFRHMVERSESQPLPGHFCGDSDVWVVETDNGVVPLVQADAGLLELVTKTKVQREQDDQPLLAAITKTAVQLEADDERFQPTRRTPLLELVTKTEARPERDD